MRATNKYLPESSPLLLLHFREFYRQVLEQERKLNENATPVAVNAVGENVAPAVAAPEPVGETALATRASSVAVTEPGRHSQCQAIQQHLLLFLEEQMSSAQVENTEFYREARYVMVALADEYFVLREWPGRDAWLANLLETQMFHTHAAGQVFFQRLDQLLREQDPATRELACVYLLALSLGFRGKFQGRDDKGQIANYRRQLFFFIFQRSPELDEKPHLCPDAYLYTLQEKPRRRLPRVNVWLTALCLVVLVYLGVQHLLWTNMVRPLEKKTEQVKENAAALKRVTEGGGAREPRQ